MIQFKNQLSLAALVAAGALGTSASAAVIGTLTSEAKNPDASISELHQGPLISAISGDLLEAAGVAITEGTNGNAGRHVTSSVFDGQISTGEQNSPPGGATWSNGDADAPNAAGYWNTGSFVQIDLDTTVNTLGYDISLINIIQKGDGHRPNINVAVSLRTIGGSFVEIYDTGSVGTAGNVNQVAVTDDGAALLGSGIDSVRFDFGDPGLGWTWYRELDAVGTATVPEPGSLALLGLGGLLIARRRRG